MMQSSSQALAAAAPSGLVEYSTPSLSSSSHAVQQQQPQQQQQQYYQTQPQQNQSHVYTYSVVYTKHKSQKRKVWHDGRLVASSCGRFGLYQANPPPGSGDPMIDQVDLTGSAGTCTSISTSNTSSGMTLPCQTRLESEKYLIDIQGPWSAPPTTTTSLQQQQQQPKAYAYSQGMQKLLKRKFRRPPVKIPPPLDPNNNIMQSLISNNSNATKIRRVLQPGELQQRHYGSSQHPNPNQQAHSAVPSNIDSTCSDRNNPYRYGQQQPRQPPFQNGNSMMSFNHNNNRESPQQQQQQRPELVGQSLQQQPQYTHPSSRTVVEAHNHATVPKPVAAVGNHHLQDENINNNPHDRHAPLIGNHNSTDENQRKVTAGPQPVTKNKSPVITNRLQQRHANGYDPASFYGEEEDSDADDEPENNNAEWSLFGGAPVQPPLTTTVTTGTANYEPLPAAVAADPRSAVTSNSRTSDNMRHRVSSSSENDKNNTVSQQHQQQHGDGEATPTGAASTASSSSQINSNRDVTTSSNNGGSGPHADVASSAIGMQGGDNGGRCTTGCPATLGVPTSTSASSDTSRAVDKYQNGDSGGGMSNSELLDLFSLAAPATADTRDAKDQTQPSATAARNNDFSLPSDEDSSSSDEE